MHIEKLSKKMGNVYFRQIALLHQESITTGFLSTFSVAFLSTLYKAIASSPFSILYIALNDQKDIVGFIAGSLSIKKMYKWILLRYGALFFAQLAFIFFTFTKLKYIYETLFYHKRNSINDTNSIASIESEVLSIAISKTMRKKGVGRILIEKLEKFLKNNNIHTYKVITYAKDNVSNHFYLKMNFTQYNSFSHHNKAMNEYIKNI